MMQHQGEAVGALKDATSERRQPVNAEPRLGRSVLHHDRQKDHFPVFERPLSALSLNAKCEREEARSILPHDSEVTERWLQTTREREAESSAASTHPTQRLQIGSGGGPEDYMQPPSVSSRNLAIVRASALGANVFCSALLEAPQTQRRSCSSTVRRRVL